MYMTVPQMWVNTGFEGPALWTAGVSPQRGQVVHPPVHTSSTEEKLRYLRLCGLSTEVTGPMTTMRLKKDESRPEYLGTSSFLINPQQGLAEGLGGTKVNPHLCGAVVSTHVGRRAGYR